MRHEQNWDETYENCQALQQELENVGYTIDYDLDAVPYNLRKIETANGGGVGEYKIKKQSENSVIVELPFNAYKSKFDLDDRLRIQQKVNKDLNVNYNWLGYSVENDKTFVVLGKGKYAKGGGVGKKKKTDFTIAEFIQLERDKLRKHNAHAHEDDRLDWSDWKSELTNKDTQQYGIYYNSRMLDRNGDRGVFEYLPTNKNYREDDFETGGSIPERYRSLGFTKVGEKKNSTNPEKKWMVLAKKGDQYKVVHGGYKGMEDYTQHHDEKRRKRFWQRMGGINSAKANDPFSPLYWHKKFGTWEQGGEIPEDSDYVIDAKPRVIEEEQINEGAIELSNKPTKKQPAKKQDSVREIKLKLEDVNIPTKTITGSIDVFNFLKEIWDMDTINIQEDFCVLYLNRANRVISYQKLSRGGISGVVADIEIIVATASKALAKGVIIAHNHPSGNLKPSQEDIKLTQNLKQALKLIDISLLDSLIVTPQNAYYSLADEGLMYGLGGYIKRKNKFIQDKVKKVVKEFSLGKLKTSAGKKVKDIKQALAIGYSEGRTGWKHKRKK
jgi:DNA repair protein RadC